MRLCGPLGVLIISLLWNVLLWGRAGGGTLFCHFFRLVVFFVRERGEKLPSDAIALNF